MKKGLKYIRRTLAVAMGACFLLLFLDLWGAIPQELYVVARVQFVPLLMHGIVGGVALWLLLTLLFGRLYCSVICPLGLLQDVVMRLKRWWLRLVRGKKSLKTKYHKPYNILRYGTLGAVALCFALGLSYPLAMLDPYSNFGRIMNAILRPALVGINNTIADISASSGHYWLYIIPQTGLSWTLVIFAAVVVIALVVMVLTSGRLWCNTICPVGNLLGLLSRFSLIRVELESSQCNGCGLCAAQCKANCIDPESKSVDNSRCVSCFNCLDRCKKGGVNYHFVNPLTNHSKPSKQCAKGQTENYDASRRRFLKGSALTAVALPATALASTLGHQREYAPLPPGAVSVNRFKSKCTACQLCVAKCPTHVLQPALLENGLTSMMQPVMKFDVERFCNYECNICCTVCPNDAITALTVEEKKLTRVGFAHFYIDLCKVYVNDVDCGACSEHCPSQALHMVPYKGELTIPKIDTDLCIGCGGCESICPITPKAVVIKGVAQQSVADAPTVEKIEIQAIDDFGF